MRRVWPALLACVAVCELAAAEVPLPRPKPEQATVALVIAPTPRPKPAIAVKAVPDDLPSPPAASGKAWPADTGRWAKADTQTARAECERLLARLDMIWRPDSPIGAPGGCGTAAPIAVSEIASVRIDPPATVNCRFAVALHGWISGSLQPAARKELGTRITSIRNASAYACRRRNNGSSGKISEHARANALGIAGFVFARNAEVSVAGDWSGVLQSLRLSGRGNFLRRVRKDSCAYFNTVLGPGTDRFHKDHFHVDLMPLRPGRFKMCR